MLQLGSKGSSLAFAVCLSANACGCAGEVVPTPAPPAAPPPIRPPPTWVVGRGATYVGPELPGGGTLVVLGGRRAVLTKAGALENERAPMPDPPSQIIAVSSPHGVKIVALAGRTIYRLDDPLGAPTPLARLDGGAEQPHAREDEEDDGRRDDGVRIASGPDAIACFVVDAREGENHEATSHALVFIEPETGERVARPALSSVPVEAMAFRTKAEGAAILATAGLVTTTDGGATWRAVDSATVQRFDGLALERNSIALQTSLGRWSERAKVQRIDPTDARVSPAELRSDPPMLDWVRATRIDPLVLAIASGVPSPHGVLVASHARVARVDLGTGLIEEIVATPALLHGWGGTGEALWIGEEGADKTTRVRRANLQAPTLAFEDVATLPSRGHVSATAAGGVMLSAPCKPGEKGVCARQPGGGWASVPIADDVTAWRNTLTPLADGRVVALRPTSKKDAELIAVDAAGHVQHLADMPGASTPIGLTAFADGTLTALADAGPFDVIALVVPPGGAAARVTPVANGFGRLTGTHAAVFRDDGASLSDDGGRTWHDAKLPASPDESRVPARFREAAVGTNGLVFHRAKAAVAGFEIPVAPPAWPPRPDARSIAVPAHEVRAPLALACSGAAPKAATAPSKKGESSRRDPFGPRPKEAKRRVRWGGSADPPDASPRAALDMLPGERADLAWVDPVEPTRAPHKWSGSLGAFESFTGDHQGDGLLVRGDDALLFMATYMGPRQTGGGFFWVHRGRGAAASLEGPSALAAHVPERAAFSSDPEGPAAWANDNGGVFAWVPGAGAPRMIARAGVDALAIGEPTRDVVPVAAVWLGGGMLKSFPVATAAAPPEPGAWVSGATRIDDLFDVGRMPSCATRAGVRFRVRAVAGLTGVVSGSAAGFADVRLGADGHACVETAVIQVAVPPPVEVEVEDSRGPPRRSAPAVASAASPDRVLVVDAKSGRTQVVDAGQAAGVVTCKRR